MIGKLTGMMNVLHSLPRPHPPIRESNIMTQYRVYQDGKRCSEYGLKNWDIDTFETKLAAEQFAVQWAYPIGIDKLCRFWAPMELGKEYDFGMYEVPVMMKIEEVQE
jgi:hypothetical protein